MNRLRDALVLMVLAGIGLAVLREISDFPAGYTGLQTASESELRNYDFAELRRGASRDLFPFIPGYALLIAVLLGGYLWRRPPVLRAAKGLSVMVAAAAVIGVIADVVETVRFRATLDGFIRGQALGASEISTTQNVGNVKNIALLAMVLALLTVINYSEPASSRCKTEETETIDE